MCFFIIKGHAALDRNPEQGYNPLLFRLITGDLHSSCPNACQKGRQHMYHIFMMVFGMARPWRNLQPITRGGHVFHYAISTRPLIDKELFVWLLFTHNWGQITHCSDVTRRMRTLEIICQQRKLANRVPMRITCRCVNLVYHF